MLKFFFKKLNKLMYMAILYVHKALKSLIGFMCKIVSNPNILDLLLGPLLIFDKTSSTNF